MPVDSRPGPCPGARREARPAARAALLAIAVSAALLPLQGHAQAQRPAAAPAAPASAASSPVNSALDAPLFYQLLIGEMELRGGQPGTAYEVILDAARRTRDEALFRRAVEIALQARAGEQALSATRAWRQALPQSLEAVRNQLQILTALSRSAEAAEPLRTLLALTPAAERGGLIAALPRFLQRADPKTAAKLLDEVLRPYRDTAATRVPVRLARARVALAAGDAAAALALAQEAAALEPEAIGVPLLALELMPGQPAAERLVTDYLARPQPEYALRLAYVRALTNAQRYADAVVQLESATRQQPDLAPPYLSLGALHLELRQPREGEAALLRYVELAQRARAAGAQPPSAAPSAPPGSAPADGADGDGDEGRGEDDGDGDGEGDGDPGRGLVQAWLMLAQAAEQRGDFKAAEGWLARVDDPQRALEVQTRRATILARQGRLAQARELLRKLPEREPTDARAKLVAEASVLREVKRWKEAFEVLAGASQRFPGDADLIYEQAMMAEKLERLDEMERLLRRVIELKPDSAQAHNALGYSLADRNRRLPEARELIRRALELAPGDPFITDSLGWVEFRLGNREEALRLLRQAWAARPDPEIGAHLGEVLWSLGQRDEARRIWRDARAREADNEVLRETLARLRAEP